MSKFLLKDKSGEYRKKIEDPNVCRYKINGICCNEESEWYGRIPVSKCDSEGRKCINKRSCKFYKGELEIRRKKNEKI